MIKKKWCYLGCILAFLGALIPMAVLDSMGYPIFLDEYTPSNETLVIKRNNPGNIKVNDKYDWKGSVRCPGEFVCFDSVENGLRAMGILLNNYQVESGLYTIREMLTRWAPPSENWTDGYIRFVSRNLHANPDSNYDLCKPYRMVGLVRFMTMYEHGVLLDAPYIQEVLYGNSLRVNHNVGKRYIRSCSKTNRNVDGGQTRNSPQATRRSKSPIPERAGR